MDLENLLQPQSLKTRPSPTTRLGQLTEGLSYERHCDAPFFPVDTEVKTKIEGNRPD